MKDFPKTSLKKIKKSKYNLKKSEKNGSRKKHKSN